MKRLFRYFVSDQKGVAAVEFALIATPMLSLVFGLVQLAVVFFAGGILDTSMKSATRFVLTGQAQSTDDPYWSTVDPGKTPLQSKIARFREQVCRHAGIILDCDNIIFDIRVLTGFNDSAPALSFREDGSINDSGFGFSLGGSNDIVLARAMYLFPVYADILGSGLINAGTNRRLIVSTAVFVNEPF